MSGFNTTACCKETKAGVKDASMEGVEFPAAEREEHSSAGKRLHMRSRVSIQLLLFRH